MLYVRGRIIQVLEGEQQAVEDLFERIQQDPRHTEVDRVLTRPIQERLFEEWAMGYETITERQLSELSTILEADGSSPQSGNGILRTINAFYESNRHN